MSFVRLVVRGKSNACLELGPKLSVSTFNGYVITDYLSWDAFNEGIDLQDSADPDVLWWQCRQERKPLDFLSDFLTDISSYY